MTALRTPADVLRAARERIATPERWTQGAVARDVYQNVVRARDPHAVCWCAESALVLASGEDFDLYWSATKALVRACPKRFGVCHYNDEKGRCHLTILTWFDRAIALAEGAGG